MKEMNIEWGVALQFHATDPGSLGINDVIPFVRLPEVDTVIAEAVWAMEALQRSVLNSWSDALATDESALCVEEAAARDARYQRAHAFLASPLVAAWRKRQEKEQGT